MKLLKLEKDLWCIRFLCNWEESEVGMFFDDILILFVWMKD